MTVSMRTNQLFSRRYVMLVVSFFASLLVVLLAQVTGVFVTITLIQTCGSIAAQSGGGWFDVCMRSK